MMLGSDATASIAPILPLMLAGPILRALKPENRSGSVFAKPIWLSKSKTMADNTQVLMANPLISRLL
jgi:hypothetical protein